MDLKGKQTIGRYINLLHRMAGIYLGKELPPLNISPGQYIFLAELFDEQGLSQDELTKKVYVDKANTARALKKLEDNGLIKRKSDKHNKRIKRAYLEPAANSIKEDFWKILEGWSQVITKDIPENRQKQLLEDLHKMACNAEKYLQRY